MHHTYTITYLFPQSELYIHTIRADIFVPCSAKINLCTRPGFNCQQMPVTETATVTHTPIHSR